ncbi:MAG: cell division protein FtsI/penicillin-binding protein 2, partial [Candidatus Marinamargulisbacteria bacterium]
MTTRLKIISFLLYAFIVTLVLKLGYLQVVKHQHFKDKSERQLVRLVKINPHRGDIYDRNHYPLALSEACYSIYAIPHLIKSEEAFLTKVSARLNIPKKKLRKKIKSHPHFVWLKRQVPVSKYDTLQEADIEGLGYLKEEKRVYPHNALGAHMMGFVGIDNQGLGGLEYKYDTYLKGSPGKLVIEKDLRGNRLISGRRKVFPPSDGRHILTTIDEFIQYRAQLHLEKGIEKMDAERGQVIVMDPQNGDILAMAQIPSFN